MTDDTTKTEQSRVAADCPNERLVMPGATKEQQDEFDTWFNERPEEVRSMIAKTPPWNRYRLKATGQHCCMYSYSEDGTVTITVDGHDSDVLAAINQMVPTNVFGVDPDGLEVIEA